MVTTTDTFTTTVADDGTVRVPADLAKPGETVTVRVDRPAAAEPEQEPENHEPVRLTRLTAKTPEQKEELLRQINETVARLAPMLEDVPSDTDWMYDENGLPK